MAATLWSQSYKGHYIQGKVEGNHETITVWIGDQKRKATSLHGAKCLITRTVKSN